jgi:hypothetical protein
VHRTVRTTVIAVAAAAALAAPTLAGCADHGARRDGPVVTGSGSADADAALKAEDTFIGITAAQLCNIGQTVYDDANALADAYQSAPAYPGMSAQQIAELTRRLRTDRTFADRLTEQLHRSCHPEANH